MCEITPLHRPFPLRAILLLAMVSAGCAGADAPSRAVAVVDTVSGVERLRYPAGPLVERSVPVDTVAVIGDAFAEDAYQFNGVTEEGLVRDDAGNLYLLDRQGTRVLKYGPDGSHLATYGREGEGPGELKQPLGLTIGAGDTVWVADFTNKRLTGFPQETGGEPRTVPFPEDAGVPYPVMAADGDGFTMQFRPMFMFGRGAGGGFSMTRGGAEGEEAEGRLTIPLLRMGPALEPGDTLWETLEPPMDMVRLESENRLRVTLVSQEYYPEFRWQALSDGGIVVSDSVDYSLRVIAPDGSVERIIERGPPARVVTEEDREAARERVRREAGFETGVRVGDADPAEDAERRMLEQRLEKMTYAERMPRVAGLRVDPEDRIWVGVSEESADEVDRIDIYDRSGRLVAELRGVPMPHVFPGSNRIGVLRRDELDVQQVVIMEIGPIADAL